MPSPSPGTTFTLNYNFKNKKIKINLNIQIKSEQKVEAEDTHKTIEEDRSFASGMSTDGLTLHPLIRSNYPFSPPLFVS